MYVSVCVCARIVYRTKKKKRWVKGVECHYLNSICGNIIEILQIKMEKRRRKQQGRRMSLIVVVQAIGVNKGYY